MKIQTDLQASLRILKIKGKLGVLAAVSGINEKRLLEIVAGAEPTLSEKITLEAMKGS